MRRAGSVLVCFFISFWSSWAGALCVVLPNTFLRAGAGFEYPKSSWELSLYTPLQKRDTWNAWYEVSDVDGDVHWVHMSAVMEGQYCLTIKIDKTHLRLGPGKEYEILQEAKKYDSFQFLRRQGRWSQVANGEGKEFWVLTAATWVQ